MGQVTFFEHRLVFPAAPRALGLYRTSRCSLANEPFGAHTFLNQMRIGDSDEIAGCRRVFSYGPSSRPGANISMASLFGSAPDLRFELSSFRQPPVPISSALHFSFFISKFPNFQTQSASRRSAQISCRVPNPANLERCVPNSALLERRLSWAVRQHAFGFLRTVEYIPFTPIPPLTALPI